MWGLRLIATVSALVMPTLGCAHMGPSTHHEPFVLFWTAKPETLRHATHITPQVHLGKGDKEENPLYLQSAWLDRGVVPLKWQGGWCYKDKTEDEFVRSFCNAAEAGYTGIAIDEWGGGDPEFDGKFGRALVRTKHAYPDFFVAVWCFGTFRPRQAAFLRDGADMVMIERYVDGATEAEFGHWFRGALRVARDAGIVHKTVFALGINDRASAEEIAKLHAWANTPEELVPGLLLGPHHHGALALLTDRSVCGPHPKSSHLLLNVLLPRRDPLAVAGLPQGARVFVPGEHEHKPDSILPLVSGTGCSRPEAGVHEDPESLLRGIQCIYQLVPHRCRGQLWEVPSEEPLQELLELGTPNGYVCIGRHHALLSTHVYQGYTPSYRMSRCFFTYGSDHLPNALENLL